MLVDAEEFPYDTPIRFINPSPRYHPHLPFQHHTHSNIKIKAMTFWA